MENDDGVAVRTRRVSRSRGVTAVIVLALAVATALLEVTLVSASALFSPTLFAVASGVIVLAGLSAIGVVLERPHRLAELESAAERERAAAQERAATRDRLAHPGPDS